MINAHFSYRAYKRNAAPRRREKFYATRKYTSIESITQKAFAFSRCLGKKKFSGKLNGFQR